MAILDAVAFNALGLTDSVTSNIKGLSVSHQITLVQRVDKNLKPRRSASVLRLYHKVEVGKTLSLSAENQLVLDQSVQPRSSLLTVEQNLFIWQDTIKDDFAPLVVSHLALNQSAVASVAKGAYDTLVLEQSVTVEKTLNLNVEQPLLMISSTVGYLPDKYWSSYEITVIAP